ncbi:MAG TPA: hypothetical protein VJ860_13315 [Polyangia bacterium]|nr:hypothetical protein [Polyangia bacterium]
MAEPKAKDKKDKNVPRLGLDPAEPGVRSAPPATPFGIDPATSKEYVFDFHGYMLLPMVLGVHDRGNTVPGESGTVLHTPALVPQDHTRFQFTCVVPTPWVQLNLSYGNSTVAGTVIIAATTAYEGEAVYDPVRQLGVSNAYITLNLKPQMGIPLQLRAGAMQNRYGSMGAFDSGRYATPLIARINAVGQTATAAFELGELALVFEEGFGGQLGRMPTGMSSEGWNDFGDPRVGSSYVLHFHGGIAWKGLLQLGLHYVTAWSQDDQGSTSTLKEGRISVFGADGRLTAGRYGHLYAGASYVKAVNSLYVSGIIEILNARGGEGLMNEYFGAASKTGQPPNNNDGDGALTIVGFQYDMSLSRLLYDEQYHGKNPDVFFSLFGIGAKVKSDDPAYDGVLKLKGGAEVTYTMASWVAFSGRADIVRQDNKFNRRSFDIYTARLLFHTGWLSRDEFSLQYSRFVYGREVYAESGYPPADDTSLNPDRHVLSLSATFWW